jgi:very-short-patch-repair endonuclease
MSRDSAKTVVYRRFSRTRDLEQAVARLAAGQHGVVGRSQLEALGLGEEAIRHRRSLGRLHRLTVGAFAVGHRAVSTKGWWMAAVLTCGADAALSHHAAAALWGIRNPHHGAVDVTLPRKSRSCRSIRRHYSPLPADEVTVEDGIPVTGVPRTILDLAASESTDRVGGLLREAEFRELHDRLSLPDLLERYPGRRGVRRVREALRRVEGLPPGRTESPLEERFGDFLNRHRLPQPRFNDWIVLGPRRFQVDCHWPGSGQIVELDGWSAHATRSAFREDRARDRALRAGGYTVTRLTWSQLSDEPEQIATDLRLLLPPYKRP